VGPAQRWADFWRRHCSTPRWKGELKSQLPLISTKKQSADPRSGLSWPCIALFAAVPGLSHLVTFSLCLSLLTCKTRSEEHNAPGIQHAAPRERRKREEAHMPRPPRPWSRLFSLSAGGPHDTDRVLCIRNFREASRAVRIDSLKCNAL
jgi:hypothetical protein